VSPSGRGADNGRWVLPFGEAGEGAFAVSVTEAVDGWRHTSLRIAHLDAAATLTHDTGDEEVVVVPLTGSVTIEVSGGRADLARRARERLRRTQRHGIPAARTRGHGACQRRSGPRRAVRC